MNNGNGSKREGHMNELRNEREMRLNKREREGHMNEGMKER